MEKVDGHFLRKLREERGWSLREFAEKIYTSKSTVQRWEQSSPPGDEETRARIAEAFGMSEEALRARGEAFRTEQARAEQKKREKELTPEQLAELKFGTKKLLVALGVLAAAALLAVLLPLLLPCCCERRQTTTNNSGSGGRRYQIQPAGAPYTGRPQNFIRR